MATVTTQPVGEPKPIDSTTPAPAPDPLDSLMGSDRDAYSALTNLFTAYGLGTLAPTILKFIQQGYGADTISLMLQQTPEYQQRFAANALRLKAGLPVLSPKDYLATESAYRDVLRSAGLPSGFYDQSSDFTNWLSGDVSPNELNNRVKVASDLLYNTPQEAKDLFYQYTGADAGHALAYILDEKRATPLIQQKYNEAAVAGAARQQGYGITENDALNLVNQGVSGSQAAQGFGQIGGYLPQAQQLGNIYGTDYNLGDAIAETFGTAGAGTAAQKRRGLASQERAAFGGTSGVNQYSNAAPSVSG